MLKSRLWLLIAIAISALTACKKNETSVTLDASDASGVNTVIAASADTPTSGTQTLSSRDDKLSIVVDGNFNDEIDDAENWVRKENLDTLILLQHDDSSNITLIANDLGPIKLKAEDYFKNLAANLKNNAQISNVNVGIATDNRMNYRFSHEENGILLNESCVAMIGNNNLYSVCANSDTAKDDALAATLKTINLQIN